MKNGKILAKNQWDEKYLRESLWMPFGSMMNAFGQINQGRFMDYETFENVAKSLFKLCLEFTEQAYNRASQEEKEEEIDLPEKNENQ